MERESDATLKPLKAPPITLLDVDDQVRVFPLLSTVARALSYNFGHHTEDTLFHRHALAMHGWDGMSGEIGQVLGVHTMVGWHGRVAIYGHGH